MNINRREQRRARAAWSPELSGTTYSVPSCPGTKHKVSYNNKLNSVYVYSGNAHMPHTRIIIIIQVFGVFTTNDQPSAYHGPHV
jgi:hypothetical protein